MSIAITICLRMSNLSAKNPLSSLLIILAKLVSDMKYAYIVASAPLLHSALDMTANGKKLRCEKKDP